MEIKVSDLKKALQLLKPVAKGGRGKKAGSNAWDDAVLLGDGQATATDLDVSVIVRLAQAQERMVLPLRITLGTLKALHEAETVSVTAEGKRIRFQLPGTTMTLQGGDPEEFSPIKAVEPLAKASIDGDQLVNSMAEALTYAAKEDKRPVLNAVCVSLGENIEVVGADGFRMAVKELKASFPAPDGKNRQLLVPAKAVKVLEHLWKKGKVPFTRLPGIHPGGAWVSPRLLSLAYNDTHLQVEFGDVTMRCTLASGSFPNYRPLIPVDQPMKVTFHAGELWAAVNRLRPVAKDGSNIIRLTWEDGHATVEAHAVEVGSLSSQVWAEVRGGPGRIAFDIKYLREVMEGRTGLIAMETKDVSSPALFRYPGAPLMIVMPLMAKWDEDAPPGGEETPDTAPEGEAPASEGPARVEKPAGGDRKKRRGKRGA